MNCPKCGLINDPRAMGTVLPLCLCQWRNYTTPQYRELSDATIRELSVAFMLVLRRTPEDELFENVYEYSKLLLKKASEK